ncbi:hypothetical protein ACN6Q3_14790, partial [Acinetobacter baumannii]
GVRLVGSEMCIRDSLSVAATAEGPMPNATAHYWRRFGGLVATNERLNHALL